jgi:hypothetical protein
MPHKRTLRECYQDGKLQRILTSAGTNITIGQRTNLTISQRIAKSAGSALAPTKFYTPYLDTIAEFIESVYEIGENSYDHIRGFCKSINYFSKEEESE